MTCHKLLLVHPDPLGAAMLCSMIRPLGLSLDEAENERTAARRLDQGPALLLAAVNPSDPDAFELLVYSRRKHPEIPVVLLFPTADPNRSAEALRLGASAVMKFPCPPAELRTTVAFALRETPPTPEPSRVADRTTQPEAVAGVVGSTSTSASTRRAKRSKLAARSTGRPNSRWDDEPGDVRNLARRSSSGLLPLKKALEGPERRILLEALSATGWNRREASKILQINRTTLYKKLKKYGLLDAGQQDD